MVMKMNTTETTMTEVISQQPSESANTITIALHPQPKNLELVCDSHSAVTGETTLSLTNMSPASSEDSLHKTQMLVKRSLKLDLNKNDDERVESLDSGSPSNNTNNNEGEGSMKSPRSPMSPGRSGELTVLMM